MPMLVPAAATPWTHFLRVAGSPMATFGKSNSSTRWSNLALGVTGKSERNGATLIAGVQVVQLGPGIDVLA